MSDFDCPNPKCKQKAERLVATEKGLGCDKCIKLPANFPGCVRIVNKYGMTHADKMHIKTNKKRLDGTFKPDPRWR